MQPNNKAKNKYNPLLLILLVAFAAGFWFLRDTALPQPEELTLELSDQSGLEINAYADYSPANLQAAQGKGDTVLFFAATLWCETCSAMEAEILERIREIPPDLTILKVDFDRNTELKRRYDVAYQHTLVLLDQEEQVVRRWIGGGVDELLLEVYNAV